MKSCGNSSKLVRRSQVPKAVIRGSLSILNTGPLIWLNAVSASRSISAPVRMERNLYMVKGLPCRPARRCGKMTGPGDVSLMPMAMSRKKGAKKMSATRAMVRSIKFFTNMAQDNSGVTRKTSIGVGPSES